MSPFCLKAIFFLGDTSSVVLWSFWHLLKKSLKALRFVLLYLSNMFIQEKITTFIRSILKNNSIIKKFKWALRHCTVVSRRLKDSGRSIMTVFRLVLLEFLNSATFPQKGLFSSNNLDLLRWKTLDHVSGKTFCA